MAYLPRILALDLASRTGWACGNCSDAVPRSGSVRFARDGARMGALFAGCRQWLSGFVFTGGGGKVIVFEAPMDPTMFAGARRPETARQLIGLCAIVEECTYRCGYDVREARGSDVRVHFL